MRERETGRDDAGRSGRAVRIALALLLALPGCSPAHPRNAVVIVLDTLRADRLSGYGNPRPTSPVLDALGRDGALFESVVSNAPWTLPAMVGLMTGEYPTARSYAAGLRRSLVEDLRAHGFATAAFTEGAFVSARYGFDAGFDEFREHEGSVPFLLDAQVPASEQDPERGIARTFGWARAWLEAHASGPRFFLLVHTYEPHVPYRRRTFAEGLPRGRLGATFEAAAAITAKQGELSLGAAELEYVRALYDGGVAACDGFVGALLADLARLGLADETLVVVTSDHGEDLGDRLPLRLGNHGHALYDEQLRVPLVLRDPTRRFPVRRVTAQVRLVDVMPTVLDLLGLPPPSERHGRSLVPLLLGEEREERLAWAEIPHHVLIDPGRSWAVRTGAHKLIAKPKADAPGEFQVELYDLAADAQERTNRAESDPRRSAALFEQLRSVGQDLSAHGPAVYTEISDESDPALRARLRSLGYVE